MRGAFDEDLRYCAACRRYVRYLLSLRAAYCIECGGEVTLFSEADRASFGEDVGIGQEFRTGPPPA